MPKRRATKKPVETAEPDVEEEVEMDESLDDAAFIEEQEEEDADVTDIIGGDIENEEEGYQVSNRVSVFRSGWSDARDRADFGLA